MDFYQQNIGKATQTLAHLKRKVNVLALSRLGVILFGGVALFQVVQTESVSGVVFLFFSILLLFLWLVYRQSRLEHLRQRWSAYQQINQNELDIQDGKSNLYDDGTAYESASHPYSDDLDVYGPRSLYAYCNRCATPAGRKRLADWLGGAADEEEVQLRQDAVRELASDPHWNQQFQVDLFASREENRDLNLLFSQYIGEEPLRFGNRGLRLYVRIAPFLLGACFLLGMWVPALFSLGGWLLIVHLLATLAVGGKVSRITGRADKAAGLLKNYADAIARIERRDWQRTRTRHLSGPLTGSDKPISSIFKELAVLLERLDYRLNMLVGALLNMFLIWDFRQVFALQDWQRAHGKEVLASLEVVAEFEALTSLAMLLVNHPEWTMPRVLPASERCLEVREMRHPLIPSKVSIPNDYSDHGHRIALITGSNMAGKSTFLRTVGLNTVLALAGGPVCAAQMDVSVRHLISYMRIKDSLQESTSTFKAELDRMKMILGTVTQQPDSFFLVDEMLRGTNSVDKYRGSKAIIERLIRDGAAGMVATHDLQLALLEDAYPDVVRNFHFDIQVRGGEMYFDYKLKNGACKVFNASMLLRGIGIEVDPPTSIDPQTISD